MARKKRDYKAEYLRQRRKEYRQRYYAENFGSLRWCPGNGRRTEEGLISLVKTIVKGKGDQ